jgi:hypothetical protein
LPYSASPKEITRSSEISGSFCKTTWKHITENRNFIATTVRTSHSQNKFAQHASINDRLCMSSKYLE